MNVIIQNEFLKVAINSIGGGLTSFYDVQNKRELLWQGEERSWSEQDALLFPYIGRMKDGWYTVDDKRYEMPTHGLCIGRELEIVKRGIDECDVIFRSDEETKKVYPFDFVFTVTRKLEDEKLVTRMQVENLGNKPMYFGMGAHPAFALTAEETDEGTDTSGNYLDFGKKIYPFNYLLKDGKFVTVMKPFVYMDKLELTKPLMQKYKTLMLSGELTKKFDLVRGDGARVQFEIGRPPVLALWSHEQYGAFVCIEPWWGTPDFTSSPREIGKKQTINRLAAGGKFVYAFKMGLKEEDIER